MLNLPPTGRRILRYLGPHRAGFAMALVCTVLFGATDGVIPFLVKEVLDRVFTTQDADLLVAIPVALILFGLIRGLLDYAQSYLMARTGHLIVCDIRNDLQRHLLALGPEFYTRSSAGDVVSRVTGDVLLVRTLLTDSAASILRDSIRLVALLSAALYLDPWLALAAAIVFPIGVVPVVRFGKRMRRLSLRGQESVGALGGLLQETMQGHRVVKVFGRERHEQERFEARNQELTRTLLSSERIRAVIGPINEFLAMCGIAAVMLYGGLSVLDGIRTQGEFIAFLLAVFLMYDPFKKLSRVNAQVQQGLSGADRIFSILDTPPAVVTPVAPHPFPKRFDLSFEEVGVVFPRAEGGETRALEHLSLTIHEGESVAFVGPSGAGKSTLVDLVPRFIDPTSGRVLLGGIDVRALDLAELRRSISMVSQHTFLFHDTIRANVAYGRAGASDEEVRQALVAAYAWEFVAQLPAGLDSVVGEGGFTLSGGQRQRLAIARALLKNAPILILDEATAALDTASEREVQLALDELQRGRTCIVVAHRLTTVERCDRIVVLEQGRIVESGTSNELIARNGRYVALREAHRKEARQ